MSNWQITCSIFGSGDTASNLGSAVDELMRHQPTLKTDATTAIIKVMFLLRRITRSNVSLGF